MEWTQMKRAGPVNVAYEVFICLDAVTLKEKIDDLLAQAGTFLVNYCPVIAIDVEFCQLEKEEKGPVAALITLANQHSVVCVPLAAFHYILPNKIASLLNSDEYCKFFVNPRNDLISLRNLIGGDELLPVNVLSIDVPFAIQTHRHQAGATPQRMALADIAMMYFGVVLDKDKKRTTSSAASLPSDPQSDPQSKSPSPQCGRWQDIQFCQDNIVYAASDATATYAGARLLHSPCKELIQPFVNSNYTVFGFDVHAPLGTYDPSSVTAANAMCQKMFGASPKIDYTTGCIVAVTSHKSKKEAREAACALLIERLLSEKHTHS